MIHVYYFDLELQRSRNDAERLTQLRRELRSIEKQINKSQWRGRNAPGGLLYVRRVDVQKQIDLLEALSKNA